MTTSDDSIQLYATIDLHSADDDDRTGVCPTIDAVHSADIQRTTQRSRSLCHMTRTTGLLSVIVSQASRSLPSCLKFSEKTHSDCKTPMISTIEPIEKTIGDLLGDDDHFQHQYQHDSFQFKRDDHHRRRAVSKLRSHARPLRTSGRYDRQARRFNPSQPQQPYLSEMTTGPHQLSINANPMLTYPSYYYTHVPSYCSCSMFTCDPSYCSVRTQYAYPDTRYNEMTYWTAESSPYRFV